jgi:predicted RNA-binding Zn-ribbon protein involved in translation (DUF1610 family)
MSYNRWPEYRRRTRVALVFVFGGLLFIAGLGLLVRGTGLEVVGSVLIMAWFCGSVVTTYRAGGFRCPRCGEQFFKTNFYHNGFARRCVHCGLPKWEEI